MGEDSEQGREEGFSTALSSMEMIKIKFLKKT